jgi:tRNA(fMet)-specific endonuclease VapC
MGLILDTCVFIQAERSDKDINFKQWENEEEIYISVVTVSELLIGVHCANHEARRVKRSAFVEAIITRIPALDFTTDSARLHAELYTSIAKQGHRIGAHDLIIAATALAHGHSVVTANRHEFERVPGLTVLSF